MLINQCEGNYSWPMTKLHTGLSKIIKRKVNIEDFETELLKFNITVSRGQLSFYRQFRSF
uniref:Uncharacterized protein n=1 Tax=Nomascus leucogenys TaxID=61853 RepID=A0A2I3FSY7_NOMLE